MIKSILLVMSLSGTAVLLFQIITSIIFKKIMSAKAKYFLLKMSIVFYLLPLPLIKNYYIDLFRSLNGNIFSLPQNEIYVTDVALNSESGNFNFSLDFTTIIILLLIVYLLIIILLARQVILYCVLKWKIRKYSVETHDKDILSILDKEKAKLKIKRKISVRYSKSIETPVTTGFIHTVILIPKTKITEEQMMWILRHELTHIYNCDYIYNLLCIIAVALHWFNPFVYLLFKRLYNFSEFNCDESIVKNLNKEERLIYGNTVLDFSGKTNKNRLNKVMSALGNSNRKIMKERLIIVKKFNKRGKFEKIIQSIIVAATVFVSSLTVFAYQEPVEVYESVDSFNYSLDEADSYFDFSEPDYKEYKLPDLDKTERIAYYFIDEDGTINKIDKNMEKAPCNHTYKSGTYKKHILNNKGGCTVEYYNAEKCTKCGVTIVGSKINTVTFEKCPH